MNIIQSILTKNDCYKAGKTITPKGLMIHSVGCPQPKASVFIASWNKPASEQAGRQVCVHGFIDGNTADIYQTLPWNYRGWHGGGDSNNTHIGVEICEPATIKYTGGATWIETADGANTKATVLRTYAAAVELFAHLCTLYSLNPLTKGVVISHAEGYKQGIASNHGDTEHLWGKFGLTLDKFRADIKAAMTPAAVTPISTKLYRVQVGAFSVKQNAQNLVNELTAKGYKPFITE